VAALGLSQKAVYADDERSEAGVGDGVFNYSSGSDLAPNPAPSASAGMLLLYARISQPAAAALAVIAISYPKVPMQLRTLALA
jgi:hypothetical protein